MTQLWIPIADAVDLAHLGKLAEESGELNAAVARCMIQGMDGAEPDTGKINRDWLAEEIADVRAMSRLAIWHFDLDNLAIARRVGRKIRMKQEWHRMLRESGI